MSHTNHVRIPLYVIVMFAHSVTHKAMKMAFKLIFRKYLLSCKLIVREKVRTRDILEGGGGAMRGRLRKRDDLGNTCKIHIELNFKAKLTFLFII